MQLRILEISAQKKTADFNSLKPTVLKNDLKKSSKKYQEAIHKEII